MPSALRAVAIGIALFAGLVLGGGFLFDRLLMTTTRFPHGVPRVFHVVVEHTLARPDEPRFRVVSVRRSEALLRLQGMQLRLTEGAVGGPDADFRIVESTPQHQLIEAHHINTAIVDTRYRVEAGRVVPLRMRHLHMAHPPVILLLLFAAFIVSMRTALRYYART
jgi:hypothetical protein